MKKPVLTCVKYAFASVMIFSLSLGLFSFTFDRMLGDFLKQLGLSKDAANEKITNSFLGGSIDTYGIPNIKNILLNDRAAVVKDLASYAKQFANSEQYKKEYAAMRETHKPVENKLETPEEMRTNMIKLAKQGLQQSEEYAKKATGDMKAIFEKNVEAAKQNLKNAEDPNNKNMVAYAKNYENGVKHMEQVHKANLATWEQKYPSNHLLFIKVRLQEFLDATKDIDFHAQLTEKNGKKYFVNPVYERKDYRWKMAFRAGKPAISAAREAAEQWMTEIK